MRYSYAPQSLRVSLFSIYPLRSLPSRSSASGLHIISYLYYLFPSPSFLEHTGVIFITLSESKSDESATNVTPVGLKEGVKHRREGGEMSQWAPRGL